MGVNAEYGALVAPVSMQQLELKIPPVAVFFLAGLLMKAIEVKLPMLTFETPGASAIAAFLAAVGIAIAGAGILAFRRHETTVLPHAPDRASAVVKDGIFRYTRNPMYLGLGCLLLAWAVKLGNVAALAGVVLFVSYMTRFQIVPEERALAAKFGAPFEAYLKTVRRWL